MKKKTLRERKEAFKAAYRAELAKNGVIDSPKEEKPKKATKKANKEAEEIKEVVEDKEGEEDGE